MGLEESNWGQLIKALTRAKGGDSANHVSHHAD